MLSGGKRESGEENRLWAVVRRTITSDRRDRGALEGTCELAEVCHPTRGHGSASGRGARVFRCRCRVYLYWPLMREMRELGSGCEMDSGSARGSCDDLRDAYKRWMGGVQGGRSPGRNTEGDGDSLYLARR